MVIFVANIEFVLLMHSFNNQAENPALAIIFAGFGKKTPDYGTGLVNI